MGIKRYLSGLEFEIVRIRDSVFSVSMLSGIALILIMFCTLKHANLTVLILLSEILNIFTLDLRHCFQCVRMRVHLPEVLWTCVLAR